MSASRSLWPAGDAGMASLIGGFDWASTPLGPLAEWSPTLKVAVQLMLAKLEPASVVAGAGRVFIYNDRCAETIGVRHPGDLGRDARAVFKELGLSDEIERAFRGESVSVADAVVALPRGIPAWFDVGYVPIRDPAGAVVAVLVSGNETTARVQAEVRRAFLLELADALRPLGDVGAICRTVLRLLGEHLGVQAIAYTELADDGETLRVLGAWRAPGMPPLADRYRFADFGARVGQVLRDGGTAVVDDAASGERISRDGCEQVWRPMRSRASIAHALVSAGRVRGALLVHAADRREWQRADVSIVAEAGERAREAIERARAESALRASEETQAFLLSLADAIRPLSDPAAIEAEASRMISEKLRADRTYCVEIDDESASRAGHRPARFARSAAPYSHEDRDAVVGSPGGAETVVEADVASSVSLSPAERAAYAETGVRALIAVPFTHDGRPTGALCVTQSSVRAWLPAEVGLVRQTADRMASAVARARAESALRESEMRLRLALDAAEMGTFIWYPRANRMLTDPKMLELFGLPADASPSMSAVLSSIHPDDAVRCSAAIARAIRPAGDGELREEVRISLAGGAERWLAIAARAFFGGRPAEVVRMVGAVTDVTDSKRANAELRDSELRLQTLIEGVPQLVWRAVQGGYWTWASPQWTAYTGQAERDSHGVGWLDPVHPDDRERVMALWTDAAQSAEGFTAEYRIASAPARAFRWFQTRATAVRDEDGNIVEWLGTSTDVDDLRRLEQRQRVLVAELQHRTRNLLGVLRSIAERTLERSGTLGEFRSRFRRRLDALARVNGLLSRLNEGDRVTFGELVRAELSAHGLTDVNDFGGQLKIAGPENIRLRSSTVQTLALGLHELATNALKHGALSRPGGTLAIEWFLERRAGAEERLKVQWTESGAPVAVEGPLPRGYGRELIEHALPYQLGAETSYAIDRDGVRCTISLPISTTSVETTQDPPESDAEAERRRERRWRQ